MTVPVGVTVTLAESFAAFGSAGLLAVRLAVFVIGANPGNPVIVSVATALTASAPTSKIPVKKGSNVP